MNDKFFDLKKEKQDRMINAALKIFAMNGYEHASTDDMVKEAGISKGLLFHYFISKLGLYSFVYDYSVKYMMLELSTGVSQSETDYFEIMKQVWQARLEVINSYPYMLFFLNECNKETVKEALAATEEKKEVLPGWYHQMMEKVDITLFRKDLDVEMLAKMLTMTLDGLMEEQFRTDRFRAEDFEKDVLKYLDMMKRLSYATEE